ncbi:MAG: cobalamin-dependent protein [Ignavibacteriaceae bacterium]|jgi:anaerobic magnesium-protoporphyrin IX monomethyl ester cyclase|nr:cobalamin-dependent protein [Ignavibacteriaceae bacterium]
MKLLLIVPNYHCGGMEAIQGPLMNLGPLFIASAAVKNGHEVKYLDLTIDNIKYNECDSIFDLYSPDIIGVAARTHLVSEAIRVIHYCKQRNPKLLTLMGGIHATFMFQEIMSHHIEVDYILRYECEETLTLLLDALEKGDDLSQIPNLVWRKDDIVVNDMAQEVTDVNKYRPAYELIPDWNKYRNHFTGDLSAVVQFSRGCVQKCSYCSQWKFWNSWHSCSPKVFADEIEMLYKTYGIRYFLLADEAPQIDSELWEEVLNEIISKKLKGAYFATCARVKDVQRDKNIMSKYRAAGFMIILFGAEFTNNKTLNDVAKEQKFEEIHDAIQLVKVNGMIAMVDIMLGWNNDESEFFQTLREVPNLNADFICYFWTTPYPWTKSFNELTERYNLDGNYENYNFMTFFGNSSNQRSLEKELIKFYFWYHFKIKHIYNGFFTGSKMRRRIFRSIYFQGLIKSIVQIFPIMSSIIHQNKTVVNSMYYGSDKKSWSL